MSRQQREGSGAAFGLRLSRWVVALGLGLIALIGASGLASRIIGAPAVTLVVGLVVGGCTTALVRAGMEGAPPRG